MSALSTAVSRPLPATEPAPRLRALLLSFEFGERISGGLGRVINGITEELRHEVDLDVYLVSFDFWRLRFSAKLYRCDREQRGVLVETFEHGSAWRNCVDLLQRERYALLHVFAVHSSLNELLDLLSRELPEQRIVYSVHSLVKFEQGIRRSAPSFLDCEARLLRASSLIHVLNHSTLAAFERTYPELAAAGKPTRIIPNGVSLGDFGARDPEFEAGLRSRLTPGSFTVVCLSRWAHGKGLEYFIEAAEQLLADGHDMQFVLAGRKLVSWEKDWYAYLFKIQRQARRLGRRLVLLGWLDASQRNSLFELADCCVMPSELEYYPYSVLEPSAAGVPLVCSDLPCVRELLEPNVDCRYFEPKNPARLAEQLLALAADPHGAERLAQGARRKVTQVGDWRSLAQRYHALYREALALPPARPSGAA